MEKRFKQLISEAKKVGLREDEKLHIRDFLSRYMAMRPVMNNVPGRQLWQQEPENPYGILLIMRSLFVKPMPIVLVIALLLGGGTSFAAERALPGDTLYPVKIHVNEEVRSLATFSTQARADWEMRRASRRLEEAEQLATENKLNANAKAQVEENFEAHAQNVKARIADFEDRDDFQAAAEISSNFESSLHAHASILAQLAQRQGEQGEDSSVTSILAKVEQRSATTTQARLNAEEKLGEKEDGGTGMQIAAQGKLKTAERKIDQVHAFLDRLAPSLGADVSAEAQAQLRLATDTVAMGKAKLGMGSYKEAFALFQKAQRLAEEAKVMAAAKQDFGISIRFESRSEDHEDENFEPSASSTKKTRIRESQTATSVKESSRRGEGRDEENEGDVELESRDELEARMGAGSATIGGDALIRLGL